MWGPIVELVLKGLAKLLPFLFVYKAGKDSVEKDNLTKTVEEGKVRNEIEHENDGLDRDAIVNKLRRLEGSD